MRKFAILMCMVGAGCQEQYAREAAAQIAADHPVDVILYLTGPARVSCQRPGEDPEVLNVARDVQQSWRVRWPALCDFDFGQVNGMLIAPVEK